MGEGVLDAPVPGTYYNGLLGVSIIPYIAKAMAGPDAIGDVPTDSQPASSSAPIYNLQGQLVSPSPSLPRGLYIHSQGGASHKVLH